MPSSEDVGPLSVHDLRTFDEEGRALLLDMQEKGWVGRRTSRGHVLMYAPDGEHTLTFSRESLRGRAGRNARGYFTRWLRLQGLREERN